VQQVSASSSQHSTSCILYTVNGKSKAVPITGRGGLQGCEMLRIPHCLDTELEVVDLTCRLRFTPQKHYLYASGAHFC
jgi:hypothetical protein